MAAPYLIVLQAIASYSPKLKFEIKRSNPEESTACCLACKSAIGRPRSIITDYGMILDKRHHCAFN